MGERELALEAMAYSIEHYTSLAWDAMAYERTHRAGRPATGGAAGGQTGPRRLYEEEAAEDNDDRNGVAECPIAWDLHAFMEAHPELVELPAAPLRATLHKIVAEEERRHFTLHTELLRFLRGPRWPRGGRDQVVAVRLFTVVKTLGPGECFGELALVSFSRRAARVTCTQATALGALEKRDYSRAVGHRIKADMQGKIDFLRQFRIFRGLSTHRL